MAFINGYRGIFIKAIELRDFKICEWLFSNNWYVGLSS